MNYLSILIQNTNYVKYIPSPKLNGDNFYIFIKSELFNFYNSNNAAKLSYDLLKYVAIPFLLFIIVSLVSILIIHRYGFEKKLILKRELDIKTDNFLTELIFSDYDKKIIKNKIDAYKEDILFNKKWYKGLILNKIISIKQNINGVDQNLLLQIYKSFGFHNYSKKLILSRKWEDKLLGIYHYQILEYKIKTGYIRPYVNNHKNKYLNSNALIAMIILSDEKFELIANYQRKISDADELKILDIIYHKKSALPKNINNWLNSNNTTIVTLAIKLMVRHREALTNTQISLLLENPETKVRKETLLAIRYLYIIESEQIILNYYPNEKNIRNKISVLKTLGAIGGIETIDYASGLIFEEKNLEIKFAIVNCINTVDPTYFENYKTDDKIENDIINRILSHVNNPYLN